MSDLITSFALALLLGGIVFFAAVIAPRVFTRLPAQQAAGFLRAVFPFHYLYTFVTSAVVARPLAPLPAAVAVALTAAITIWLRQWLMPSIDVFSDAAQAGDRAAKHRCDRAHRLSVAANSAPMLIAGGVLVRFTAHGGY